jgi:hypothetical protein
MRLDKAAGERTRGRRPLLAGLAAVLFLGILGWIVLTPSPLAPVEGPLGPIPGKSEGPSYPVRRTDLEGWFGGWRNLPFEITPEEEDAVRRCRFLSGKANHTVDGVIQFTLKEVREELEAILVKRPGFFYAEHLLGVWFDLHDQKELGKIWSQRALEHAPAILVQDFVLADGRPCPELPISVLSIECNRVKEHYRFILLPVYDTVYQVGTVAHVTEFSTDMTRLGWFESHGRVGVLPPIVVRKR